MSVEDEIKDKISNIDTIEKHKMITRLMALVLTGICVYLTINNTDNDTLIEYAFWTTGIMYAALLFGDKMLVQIEKIVKAWKS